MMVISPDMDWKPVLKTPNQKRVADRLQLFLSEHTGTGGEIPPERVIAKALGVSRPTLRIVLGEMERQGLLRSMGTAGRVATVQPSAHGLLRDAIAVVTVINQPAHDVQDLGEDNTTLGWEPVIQNAAARALHARGWQTLTVNPQRLDAARLAAFAREGLGGMMVLSSAGMEEQAKQFLASGIPTVVYGPSEDFARFDTIYSDHAAGSKMLTNWLLSQGKRRILRVWSATMDDTLPRWLQERDRGHEMAMKDAGVATIPSICIPDIKSRTDRNAFDVRIRTHLGYLLEYTSKVGPFDAIMAPSDGEAISLTAALRMLGKDPVRDVPVVGYDNYFAGVAYQSDPPSIPAATVDKQNIEIGKSMVKLLLERLQSKLPPEPQHGLVEPRLVVVNS